MKKVTELLNEILENIKQQGKSIFTLKESCNYCGISASFMYKLTSKGNIKFYKPEGKLIYFRKEDLEAWMLGNPQSTNEEQQDIANAYTFNRNKSKS